MKKLFTILFLFIGVYSLGQDVVGSRVIAKQALYVNGVWVDSIRVDTVGISGDNRTLMTSGAIYKFVSNRSGGGGGGSGTVTSVAAGFGHSFSTITTTGSVIADTTSGGLLSWVRGAKLADSLGVIIATKGTGTVTSVGSGFGTNFSAITTTGSVVIDTTSGGVQSWVRGIKIADSLGAIIATKGVGTVTSVSAGYGTSFTTITGTGSVIVDTFSIATRARVQKPIDSLGVIIATKATGTINSGVTNKPAYYTASTTIDDFAAVDYATSGTNVLITTQNTTDVGLNIKGISSQSGNLLNISSSAGTADLASVNSSGYLQAVRVGAGAAPTSYQLYVEKNTATNDLVKFNSTGNYAKIEYNGTVGSWHQYQVGGSNRFYLRVENIIGSGNADYVIQNPSSVNLFSIDGNTDFVGVGATVPTSKFSVIGSFSAKYDSTAVGLTLDATHHTMGVTATGQTITLPTAASIAGRIYTIKLTASGSCTVATTSSQLIDGATTYSLASQYKYVMVQSTGANWVVIANN